MLKGPAKYPRCPHAVRLKGSSRKRSVSTCGEFSEGVQEWYSDRSTPQATASFSGATSNIVEEYASEQRHIEAGALKLQSTLNEPISGGICQFCNRRRYSSIQCYHGGRQRALQSNGYKNNAGRSRAPWRTRKISTSSSGSR
jgi:hypothetical protein